MVRHRPVPTRSGSLHNDNTTTLLLALFMTNRLEISDKFRTLIPTCQALILIQQPMTS